MRKILILWFFTFCNLTSAQIIDFPDANFKNALVNTICTDTDGNGSFDSDADLNDDGEIDIEEALKIISLDLSNKQISSLEGIGNFKNLERLYCLQNEIITLNLQELSNLTFLSCGTNQLSILNIQELDNLEYVYCNNNLLTTINVKGLVNLKTLDCNTNQLINLDVQELANLKTLRCYKNHLTALYLKEAKLNHTLLFQENPELSYICCDEDRITEIKNMAIANGQNCEVDSECSVTNTQDLYTNINTYPNPVSDILYLDTNDHWSKAEIFDIAGRVMRSVNLHSSSMDVSGLENGTYFIRLKDGEKVGLVKFVKI
ncbi:MAG TPA: T9SS type A sorting domain-containing protein [Saprospiraceae bacterium]|nr:T9SS type A sorting domain-containing protein [Saprospiraceae bacterium]